MWLSSRVSIISARQNPREERIDKGTRPTVKIEFAEPSRWRSIQISLYQPFAN